MSQGVENAAELRQLQRAQTPQSCASLAATLRTFNTTVQPKSMSCRGAFSKSFREAPLSTKLPHMGPVIAQATPWHKAIRPRHVRPQAHLVLHGSER